MPALQDRSRFHAVFVSELHVVDEPFIGVSLEDEAIITTAKDVGECQGFFSRSLEKP
jgi:hypothetical protein